MTTLYLFRGWPGSGKSTKAKEYQAKGIFNKYFENDQFMTDVNGNYNWSKEALANAMILCKNAILLELENNRDVGYCAVIANKAQVVEWLTICKKLNVTLHVIDCNGDYQNVHNVPIAKVAKMKKEFQPWINYSNTA